jgi:hypothetical protein
MHESTDSEQNRIEVYEGDDLVNVATNFIE